MNAAALAPPRLPPPILAPGFEAELMVDMPHATRAKKLYLVVESPDRRVEPEPTRSSDIEPDPTRSSEVEPGITRSSEVEPDPTRSCEVEPDPTRSSEIERASCLADQTTPTSIETRGVIQGAPSRSPLPQPTQPAFPARS